MPLPPPPRPPRSDGELLARARSLAGRTLGEIAGRHYLRVPPDLKRHKGWIGNLIEVALGAEAGSKPNPDFERLGIELKTLPIGDDGRPRESTFVCTVAAEQFHDLAWETSWVRHKLARVLWVPVQAGTGMDVGERRVGMALLWTLGGLEEVRLRVDWERHADMIRLGHLDEITAHDGDVLQIRPKATKRGERRMSIGAGGWLEPKEVRGFYLRRTFTSALMARHYVGAG